MNRPLRAPINEIPTRPRAQCSLPAPVLLADAVLALTTGLWHFDVCICVIPTHWSQVGQPLFACDFNFWQNTMKYQHVQQGSTHQLCGFELLTVYQYRFGMVAGNQFFQRNLVQLFLLISPKDVGPAGARTGPARSEHRLWPETTCFWVLVFVHGCTTKIVHHHGENDTQSILKCSTFRPTHRREETDKKRKSYHVRLPGPTAH